jgi:hypothetical protein
MSEDLVTWLRAQIDEDEQTEVHASDCSSIPEYDPDTYDGLGPQECDCGWPARVLAEVEAKRRILDLHARSWKRQPRFDATGVRLLDDCDVECEVCGWASADPTSACETVRLLALPYAGREGWREEWR